jgi:hypothetical protein
MKMTSMRAERHLLAHQPTGRIINICDKTIHSSNVLASCHTLTLRYLQRFIYLTTLTAAETVDA